MPENESTWWIRLLPCKKKKLTLSLAMIFTILCKGIRSQAAWSYTITVSPSVFVQRGLAVYIPCQFTYNREHKSRNDHIFAYWFKSRLQSSPCSPSLSPSCIPVATNDKSQTVERSATDRFYLLGDPNQGNCSLVITDARIEDEGIYYLRIEGKDQLKFSFLPGLRYPSPHVNVIEPPQKINITVDVSSSGWAALQWKEGLDHVTVQEGNTVNLSCTADGRPPPRLSWMKDNQNMDQFENDLYLGKIGPEDAGKYQCLAKNEYGSVKTMVEVIVQYRPRNLTFEVYQTPRRGSILTQGCSKELVSGSTLTAQEGDSLALVCKADSNPLAITWWMKDASRLQNPSHNPLRLTNLTVEDEGIYEWKATNTIDTVLGTFQLYVTYAPKFTRSLQKNTTCYYRDSGFLCSCTLHAKPAPQIEWEVDGKRITEESRRRGNLTDLIQGNEVTSILNWTDSLERAHNIICIGVNPYGVQAMQFLLKAKRDSTSEASKGRSKKALIIAGLCGIFLGAGICLLCLFLIRIFKQKKALSETDRVEGTASEREPQQKPKNSSHIYSNVFPMGLRLSQANKPKAAGERKPKLPQVSTVPSPRGAEPEELQYAALEFKPKNKSVPVLTDDNVEYSAVQRKQDPWK